MIHEDRFRKAVDNRLAGKQISKVDAFLIRLISLTNENMFSFFAGILTNISVSFLFNIINFSIDEHSKLYFVLYFVAVIFSIIITLAMFFFTVEVISIAQSLTDKEKDNYEARANAVVDRTESAIGAIHRYWNIIMIFSGLLLLTIVLLFVLNNFAPRDSKSSETIVCEKDRLNQETIIEIDDSM